MKVIYADGTSRELTPEEITAIQKEWPMKRITYPGDYCEDIAHCENNCGGSCQGKRQWERLRAYEDTGLTPEEVEDLKNGSSEKL